VQENQVTAKDVLKKKTALATGPEAWQPPKQKIDKAVKVENGIESVRRKICAVFRQGVDL